MSFEQLAALVSDAKKLMDSRLPEAIAEAEDHLAVLKSLAGAPAKPSAKRTAKKAPPKVYRNPDTGETYSKGPFPPWLKEKIDAGRKKEEFLVKGDA